MPSIWGLMSPLKPSKGCKKWIFILVILYIIYLLISECDNIAWLTSAVGRLALIQVLPYWDWTRLYNSRCLVERDPTERMNSEVDKSLTLADQRYETDGENCMMCEEIDYIATTDNTTFSFLEATYLERGIPVIVTDSHRRTTLDFLLRTISTEAPDFLNSEPCDLATNLMLKKLFSLELAVNKIKTLSPADKWFLQLRNCRFNAVKASRLFIRRPYYYPVHLEPFYTSWLIMANNFSHHAKRPLYTKGLVIVQQLSGEFEIGLEPTTPCNTICPTLRLLLKPSEGLIFSTDLWKLTYAALQSNETSIATILEINWNL